MRRLVRPFSVDGHRAAPPARAEQESLQAQISKIVASTPLATVADLTRQNIEALAKMQESMLSAILPKREKLKDDDEKRS